MTANESGEAETAPANDWVGRQLKAHPIAAPLVTGISAYALATLLSALLDPARSVWTDHLAGSGFLALLTWGACMGLRSEDR